MRTMRMEREDIENSLKVLSHIVDDDFIITVDEARKIIGIDGETIKALQAEVDALKHDIERYVGINAELTTETEALQAEVERLKDSNEELREKQTYIDHYGDKWMTSAKDVPTAAYEHGYADGRDEAMAKMEGQSESISKFADGEWWKEARK